jgi:hypothetical protein
MTASCFNLFQIVFCCRKRCWLSPSYRIGSFSKGIKRHSRDSIRPQTRGILSVMLHMFRCLLVVGFVEGWIIFGLNLLKLSLFICVVPTWQSKDGESNIHRSEKQATSLAIWANRVCKSTICILKVWVVLNTVMGIVRIIVGVHFYRLDLHNRLVAFLVPYRRFLVHNVLYLFLHIYAGLMNCCAGSYPEESDQIQVVGRGSWRRWT